MKINADPWESTKTFCKSVQIDKIIKKKIDTSEIPAKLHDELNQNEHVLLSTHINEHILAMLASCWPASFRAVLDSSVA